MLGSIFPMLQKISGIIFFLVFLNQNGNDPLLIFERSNAPSTGMSIAPTSADLSF
jgi:hypothetical protein